MLLNSEEKEKCARPQNGPIQEVGYHYSQVYWNFILILRRPHHIYNLYNIW